MQKTTPIRIVEPLGYNQKVITEERQQKHCVEHATIQARHFILDLVILYP